MGENSYSNQALEELKNGLPCGKMKVKLASTESERQEVFRLRYRVFNEELGEGIPESALTGMDSDEYDTHCDHLMVITDDRVIGTYRLLYGPQRPEKGFYTETEFDLKKLPIDFSNSVELGRGCIEAEFRKQTTLMALFWGLYRYVKARNARYLLGCASLPLMSENDAEASFQLLKEKGHVDLGGGAYPLAVNNFQGNANEGVANIPPLIKFYIQFGAKIWARPAYDPVFKVYDLLMAFDMEHLSTWGIELLARFDKRLQ